MTKFKIFLYWEGEGGRGGEGHVGRGASRVSGFFSRRIQI